MIIHIVGAMTVVHGKSYLLARELTLGDRTITVRNTHGLPVLEQSPNSKWRARVQKTAQTESNGGAR
jgi:hypothetical protein